MSIAQTERISMRHSTHASPAASSMSISKVKLSQILRVWRCNRTKHSLFENDMELNWDHGQGYRNGAEPTNPAYR